MWFCPTLLLLACLVLAACAPATSRGPTTDPHAAPVPEVLVQGEVMARLGFTAHSVGTRKRSWACWTSVQPDGTIVASQSGHVPRPAPAECCCGERRLQPGAEWRAALLSALEATELVERPPEEDEEGISAGDRDAVLVSWPSGVRRLRAPEAIQALVCSACAPRGVGRAP